MKLFLSIAKTNLVNCHAISYCVLPFSLLKSSIFILLLTINHSSSQIFSSAGSLGELWEKYIIPFFFLWNTWLKGKKLKNTNSLIMECSMSCIQEGMVCRHVHMSGPDQLACLWSKSRDRQTTHKSAVLPAFDITSNAYLPSNFGHLDMSCCSHFQPHLTKYTIFQIQKEFILVIQNLVVCIEANYSF